MKITLGAKLSAYRKQCKLSQIDLANELKKYDIHIKNGAISAWEKDSSVPSSIQLLALCRILGITEIYEEFIGPNPNDIFANLNDAGKEKVMEYIDLLLLSDQYKKQPATIIPFRRMIPLSLQGTSAGTGDFMEDENFEMIEVGEEVPGEADFGVRLNGDSMQPRFQDDEIVWIKKETELVSGDIGIFYLDGMTYCKQLKKDQDGTFLISLNTKYNPIPVTEHSTFIVFGRVLC
ncbi:MAG: XRE family transcriptional regulator [Lachnospiraceae bacterium]|nr:XRE family transcriptional regulator [Lachnospiraceae bacterium]